MKTRSAKAKGKELENWLVEKLRSSGLDPRAYPQKGSGSGLNKGDVWNALDIHFECKNQARPKFKEWWKQVDAENVSHLSEALVWHMPQTSLEDSVVILRWPFFEELLKGKKV